MPSQVLEDYSARLSEAQETITDLLEDSMQQLARTSTRPSLAPQALMGGAYIIYNPLPYDRRELVNISFTRPIGVRTSPTLLNENQEPVSSQIGVNDTLLAMMFTCTVSCAALYTDHKYDDVIFFLASVPAFGFTTFTLVFDPLQNSSSTVSLLIYLNYHTRGVGIP